MSVGNVRTWLLRRNMAIESAIFRQLGLKFCTVGERRNKEILFFFFFGRNRRPRGTIFSGRGGDTVLPPPPRNNLASQLNISIHTFSSLCEKK